MKVSAFELDQWLDIEVGAYGSDPHEERYELVAIARQRAADKYGEPTGAVLVGDTPLDVRAARDAGARAVAVATGFSDLDELRAAEPDAVLEDLSDTAAAVRYLRLIRTSMPERDARPVVARSRVLPFHRGSPWAASRDARLLAGEQRVGVAQPG